MYSSLPEKSCYFCFSSRFIVAVVGQYSIRYTLCDFRGELIKEGAKNGQILVLTFNESAAAYPFAIWFP